VADAAPAAASPAPAQDEVTAKVLEIVSGITGYPPEMLDLDLDLEADLGIDTVKQAETFAAIRGEWDIPRDENLQLRDYPTIAHAIGFVHERAPAGTTATEPSASIATEVTPADAALSSRVVGDMEASAALPRRSPRAVLRPALELCKETGVALGDGSRVIVMPDTGGVGGALVQRLRKRGVVVLELDQDTNREQLREQIGNWQQDGPIDGLFWLPALDSEDNSADLGQWRRQLELRVKLLHAAARALYDDLARPGAFLISGTRLGGRHGYDAAGALSPMGGAVTGFTKAFAREQGSTLVKAVDFAASRKTAALADLLIEETLRDPGAVEVGHCDGFRWTVSLWEQDLDADSEGMSLDGETVFVITGAAGSIVSAITADLADASAGTFYLLDLAPPPDPENTDIRRVVTDREALKRDIFEQLRESGERATPALVEKQIAVLERANAALTAIESVRAAGGSAVYCQLDLTDADATARVIADIRSQHGRIDVLLHAAGLEISRPLPDKSAQEFDLVFDVKCDGWFNLVHAIGDMPLGAAVVFSSIAGRFGNIGQTDYSAANDLMCKSISAMRTTHPQTRGLALDWTAWADIGMASRGSIPQIMAAAGIDMLAPEAGIPLIRRELTAGDGRGELVVAQRLGILCEERDDTGGIDPATLAGSAAAPMLGRVKAMSVGRGLEVETELDPTRQPFLYDHKIDDNAVLPGVMAIEAFSELGLLMFPERTLVSAENVQFLAPCKFYRDEPQTLLLSAQFDSDGDDVLAHCRCLGSRRLHGQEEPRITTHFLATVRLAPGPSAAEPRVIAGPDAAPALSAADLYRIYFHGPAYQVVGSAWRSPEGVVGAMTADLPAELEQPGVDLVARPRLLELCFQTAGVWEIGSSGQMGLPSTVRRINFFAGGAEQGSELRALALRGDDGEQFDALVADASGQLQVSLEGYRTIAFPGAIDGELLAPLQELLQ
jgi:NAD(P)-dependent dehydrogenase (short-subunit alcohol dehydrogenase family)